MIKNKSKIYLLKQGSKKTRNDPEQSTTTDKDQEKPTTTHNNPNQFRTTQEIIKTTHKIFYKKQNSMIQNIQQHPQQQLLTVNSLYK